MNYKVKTPNGKMIVTEIRRDNRPLIVKNGDVVELTKDEFDCYQRANYRMNLIFEPVADVKPEIKKETITATADEITEDLETVYEDGKLKPAKSKRGRK